MDKKNIYSIGKAADKTGLNPLLIRAWENRYGAVEPKRTDTNRRVYCDKDIQKLRLLSKATKEGHNIGQIAHLTLAELKELVGDTSTVELVENAPAKEGRPGPDDFISEALEKIRDFDQNGFEIILRSASMNLSKLKLIEDYILPLIRSVGESWQSGELRISQEHFASAILSAFLKSIRDNNSVSENAPVIVVGTPRGQKHELGALAIAVLAGIRGYSTVYIGADVPSEEIAAAALRSGAVAVALSIVYPMDDMSLFGDLSLLSDLMQEKRIFIGGSSSMGYNRLAGKKNIRFIDNIGSFLMMLDEIRAE